MRRMEKVTGRSDDMLIIRGVNVCQTYVGSWRRSHLGVRERKTVLGILDEPRRFLKNVEVKQLRFKRIKLDVSTSGVLHPTTVQPQLFRSQRFCDAINQRLKTVNANDTIIAPRRCQFFHPVERNLWQGRTPCIDLARR